MLGYLLGAAIYQSLVSQRGAATVTDFEARTTARRLEHQANAVAEDLATMALVNKVLLRMLIEKDVCTEQEFVDLFTRIDMEDGKADGKLSTTPPKDCPKCGKRMPQNRTTCIYCGHQIHGPSVLG